MGKWRGIGRLTEDDSEDDFFDFYDPRQNQISVFPISYEIEATAAGALPERVFLYPGYPNPFNARTVIKYFLQQAGEMELSILNTQGQRVRTIYSGTQAGGFHQQFWDGTDDQGRAVPSAVYWCCLRAHYSVLMTKILLVG